MNAIIRNTGPRGPRFYLDGEALRFVNVIDASTRDGPRDATDADREAFPEALAAHEGNEASMFPGAAPMITFSGEAPPHLINQKPLSVPPPEYVPPPEPVAEAVAAEVEPATEDTASRKTLHLKTA